MFFLIGNIEYSKSHPSFYFTKKSPQVVSRCFKPHPVECHTQLVGGFNPFEKYSSNWIISPGRVKIKNI